MKILFITRFYYPHIGGVEKHVKEITKVLKKKGHIINIVSDDNIKYPDIKVFGLVFIWIWLFKNRRLVEKADIVHCHDVFVWYLPFRFLYPKRSVFTTIHGLEWDNPLSKIGILQKRLAVKLSTGTVGVGKFLEKCLRVKFDLLTYGAVSMNQFIDTRNTKVKGKIVYVGRLEENTGLLEFIKWLRVNNKWLEVKGERQEVKGKGVKVDFCGDGPLRKECEKYGIVHGFTDPTPYYKKAEYCVPGGYLAALEALSYHCKLKLFWNNQVKRDYWKMSPFYKLKGEELRKWAKLQTWDKLADEYLDLYNHVK